MLVAEEGRESRGSGGAPRGGGGRLDPVSSKCEGRERYSLSGVLTLEIRMSHMWDIHVMNLLDAFRER